MPILRLANLLARQVLAESGLQQRQVAFSASFNSAFTADGLVVLNPSTFSEASSG